MGGLGQMKVPDVNGPRSDLLSFDGVFQFVVKRIVFENAQGERAVTAIEGFRRPLHKLREME
jgi:hypothetical protein